MAFWDFERRQSSKDHHPDDNTASTRTKPGSNTAPTQIVPDSHCRAMDLHIIYTDNHRPRRHLHGPSRTSSKCH
ncbi:hypothetical protein DPMN_138901 [Dreissena polymorpha]|uniref:Uncharacterized protein n=1 Tax=Dreissena polymorpha TaxID=45954 RepID=A0A9D4G820_DREPO|nr:hypothetical protein DPMN_138901 [Dreissena polymorpha]